MRCTKSDALVEALDIYPTLLDLCGVEKPSHLQGESLVPLLQNPASEGPSEAVSQYPRNGQNVMGYSQEPIVIVIPSGSLRARAPCRQKRIMTTF